MSDLDATAYVAGNNAPVSEEVTAFDLPVTGELPSELEGRLLRNGPNPIAPIDPTSHHWFLGDGMVHGVRLSGGRAEWYRNRYVGSSQAEALRPTTAAGTFPNNFGPNTNVIGHAGKTLAIVEAGTVPVELSYELDSIRPSSFEGTLANGFSAHPKYDPLTGEMHAVCYSWPDLGDKLQYVVVGADGRVTKTLGITAPTMPMVHDMSLTQTYAVVFDFPVAVDIEMALGGSNFPFRWFDDYNTRIGLLPRTALTEAEITWVEIDPVFAFHPLNAFDGPDGSVVIDICEYDRMFDLDPHGPFREAMPRLARWTVNPSTRQMTRHVIDDRPHEFPRTAGSVANVEYQFGYTVGIDPQADGGVKLGATFKHDLSRGTTTVHDHGPGREAGEPVFVGKSAAESEDDGWLLTVVYDGNTDLSDLVVLDANDIAREVARVSLPARVPTGFHGNWVRDTGTTPPPA